MLGQYLPVLVMAVLAVLFAVGGLATSRLLAPKRPTAAKSAPYECGIVPSTDPPQRFPVRFFLVAMIFIVFDIELIFLYPWATIYRDLGPFGLVEVGVFAFAVLVSFAYLLSHGALDWGPRAGARRLGSMVSADRRASTTIRRVGLDGRAAPEQASPAHRVAGGRPGEAA